MPFKMISTLILVLLCLEVKAESPYQREVDDLMYFPDAKMFFGITQLELETNSDEFETGGNSFDTESREDRISQFVGYSFTDSLLVMASVTNIFRESDITGSGDDQHAASNGITRPTLSLKWRALDQTTEDIAVDVMPFFVFESGTPDSSGTNAHGNPKVGDGYGLEVNIGKKWDRNEFKLLISGEKIGSYVANDNTTQERRNFDSYNRYEVSGHFQRQITPKLSGRGNIGYRTQNDHVDYDSSDAVFKYDDTHTYLIGVGAVMTPKDFLAMGLDVSFSQTKSYSVKTTAGDLDYEKIKGRTISLWARYQF